ncbi:MAG TPA: capsule assembly Wzi family protein [Terriglobales bacterium]|nr:capsule assembly Wzi family protein [Terriglobales bacterium]
MATLSMSVHAQPQGTSSPSPAVAAGAERSYELEPGEDPQNRLVSPFIQHVAQDQAHFWTAPAHLRTRDLRWIAPLAAGTGLLIAGDSWLSKQVPASHVNTSKSISNYAAFSLIGAAGGSYLWGHLTKNDHLRETGFLAGEAALDSTAVAYALKTLTQRPRPLEGNGGGTFFQGGSSFPSEHSAIAWSVAGVIAHEYPGPLTKLAAYGLASAVTLTRVTGKQHFPSDVVIGGALGWYFAHEVFRAHHDPELGGTAWGNLVQTSTQERTRDPRNMSSPYVPLDSWTYPVIERLIALGYMQSGYLNQRPWTRMEVARLLEEAEERIRYSGDGDPEVQNLYSTLLEEFGPEVGRLNGAANLGAELDSVYVRGTQVSGTALRDSYHFAQTLTNDYGRPYSTGFNAISGFSAHAVAGPLSFAVQGEYQHAPAIPSYSPQALQAIAGADFTLPFSNAHPRFDRFDLLNSTVALTFHNLQVSFGKQSQWLGPSEAGPLLMSNNAEPFVALKLDSVSPYRIPLVSNLLGPAKSEFFLGQLSGHHFEINDTTLIGPADISPQPYIHGFKTSFKPTPNFEFGMGVTAMFAGPGLPFTLSNFLKTFYAHKASAAQNPGKRFSEFDFSYRVPGLRNWLTIYMDSLVVDEFSPIGSTRPSLNPGFYLPKLPKIPKMDFRAEVVGTPHLAEFVPGFVYFDIRRFRDGYTNDGSLLASWIGRSGRGAQAWSTYWLSPRTKFQFAYRYQKVGHEFLEGGHLNDFAAHGDFMLNSNVALSGSLQYEHWAFPILSATGQSNVTASFQLTYFPHWSVHK